MPTASRKTSDLEFAEARTRKAVHELDQAMSGYTYGDRYDRGYLALKAAMNRAQEALEEVRADRTGRAS